MLLSNMIIGKLVANDNEDKIDLDQLREQAVAAMNRNYVNDKARLDKEKAKVQIFK